MAGKTSYATASRRKILEILKGSRDRTLTASEIDAMLRKQDSPVNITTIYRYLDRLEEDGTVLRYTSEQNGQALYQYVDRDGHCQEHLHMKCVKCGRIYHLDCDFMKEIAEHIQKDHGFSLQCRNSILYGVCKDCGQR
ncbi:MAG: transcriptional repressor [Lachnospiraceae bacterium]|nr:transcriptional repressor [Lachnospiraceae bacterium]